MVRYRVGKAIPFVINAAKPEAGTWILPLPDTVVKEKGCPGLVMSKREIKRQEERAGLYVAKFTARSVVLAAMVMVVGFWTAAVRVDGLT